MPVYQRVCDACAAPVVLDEELVAELLEERHCFRHGHIGLEGQVVKWVWVKIKPPGCGPQVLVLGSIYQGSILAAHF